MKKGLVIFTIITLITVISLPVFASAYTVKILTQGSNQINLGDTVTFIVQINNIDEQYGVGAISGKIEYNKSIFELIKSNDITPGEGWGSISFNDIEDNSQYGSFVTERSSGDIITNDNELMKITAKVKNDAMPGATTIKITNLSASDGNDDFTTEDVSLSVTIVKNEPDDDNNNDDNNNDNNNNDDNNNDNNNNDNNNNDNNNDDNNNDNNNNDNNNNDDNNNDNNNNDDNNNDNNNNDNNNDDNNNDDNNNGDDNNNDNNNNDNNNDDNNNGDDNNNDNNNNNNNNDDNNNDDNNNDDNNNENTPADGKLPYAGIEDYIIPTILILCVVGITSYIRYKKI